MKYFKTIIFVLLNGLFCCVLLWFFTRNAFLRPYAGSPFKEIVAGCLLLGSLYVNYFLLYPKLYHNYPKIYWIIVVFIALTTGLLDLIIAYPNIVSCSAPVIEIVGFFNYFYKILLFIVSRNLALNFFPFLLSERYHFQQAFENEVKVVYRDVRKLDVVDGHNNIQLVSIDDIFYCQQKGNFTNIFLVQNKHYSRTCSMKHLEQLFGDDFIRISRTELVPFRYIKACKGNIVVMKKMPWEEVHTSFELEPQKQDEVSERILEGLLRYRAKASGKNTPTRPTRPKIKRKPVTPSDEKIKAVFSFIGKHSNCNTGDIIAETNIPLSTVERCIAVLKKQGLVEYTGSSRKGGYHIVNAASGILDIKPIQQEELIAGKLTDESGSSR